MKEQRMKTGKNGIKPRRSVGGRSAESQTTGPVKHKTIVNQGRGINDSFVIVAKGGKSLEEN